MELFFEHMNTRTDGWTDRRGSRNSYLDSSMGAEEVSDVANVLKGGYLPLFFKIVSCTMTEGAGCCICMLTKHLLCKIKSKK